MCGIVGMISRMGSQSDSENSPRMQKALRSLAHRGPDGQGSAEFQDGPWKVQLGHRRLAIIDIEGGIQPMRTRSQDGEFYITFNGEIFNFQELADGLKSRGETFVSRSDTEVLLHHLKQATSPARAIRDLNGMFAFGFWSKRLGQNGSLCLARDRMGIKPLYYAMLEDGGIAFASELSALLPFSDAFDSRLDRQGIIDFLFHDYIPAPRTSVAGIQKLAPGEFLIWEPGKPVKKEIYWSPDEVNTDPEPSSELELKERLSQILKSSVRRQLISDVPVGIFLSGGIDSSIIAALATRISTDRLKTFSIGFEEKSFDESSYAREIAQYLGADHTEQMLSERDLLSALDKALDCIDEPLADPSIIPTYFVAKLARDQVKVCLAGDGGDELWAGYSFYPAHRYADFYGKIPRFLREGVVRPLVQSLPVSERYQSMEWKAKRFVNRFDPDLARRHFRWLASTDDAELRQIFALEADSPAVPACLAKTWNLKRNDRDSDLLNGLLRLDLSTYLPGSVLTKVDRATMGVGLESRPPYLDNELVEFSLSQPSSLKLRRGVSKYLLKQVGRELLPSSVFNRPKRGFSVPISKWLKGNLKGRVVESVLNSELVRAGIVDGGRLQQVFSEHVSSKRDWSKTLWSILVLDHWYRRNSESLRIG